ncbi:MAG: 30S ribosomal protein S21 [Anaerolineaceae bacterium]|jgi:small subunit ribosomal protein S21|nr:MAG: 30S ribosomal protein S21 [Anaerolineaceae bacterium]
MFHRFRKRVLRSQTLSIVRKKRWFVSKSEQHRMDEKKAIRRALKKQQRKEYRQ